MSSATSIQAKIEVHVRVRPALTSLGESASKLSVVPLSSNDIVVRGAAVPAHAARSLTPAPSHPAGSSVHAPQPFRRLNSAGSGSSKLTLPAGASQRVAGRADAAPSKVRNETPAGSTTSLSSSRDELFSFDVIYDDATTQGEVFEESVLPLLDTALAGLVSGEGEMRPKTALMRAKGCTVCVMCYGPTGSGKTHTMVGEWPRVNPFAEDNFAQTGLLPRVVATVLSTQPSSGCSSAASSAPLRLQLFALEVYLDQVRDLFSQNGDRAELGGILSLRDPDTMDDVCSVCTSMDIGSIQRLKDVHRTVTRLRVTSSNKRNDMSSRSHCIFILRVTSSTSAASSAHVVLVDLAGSERVKQSQVEGTALQEAQAINASLSSLCSVVYALNTNAKHVPYRDSRLTRLLKPCFEGSRLVCIVHTAPCIDTAAEAISTLRFAERLKETVLSKSSGSSEMAKNKKSIVDNAIRSGLLVEMEDETTSVDRLQQTMQELTAEIRLANETVGFVVRRVARLPTHVLISDSRLGQMLAFSLQHREDAELGGKLVRGLVESKTRSLHAEVTAMEAAVQSYLHSSDIENREQDLGISAKRIEVEDELRAVCQRLKQLKEKRSLQEEHVRYLHARHHMCGKIERNLQAEEEEEKQHDLHQHRGGDVTALLAVERDLEVAALEHELLTRRMAGKMLRKIHILLEWKVASLEAERLTWRRHAELAKVEQRANEMLPVGNTCHGGITHNDDLTSCLWPRPLHLSNGDYVSFT